VIDTQNPEDVLDDAQDAVNLLIPTEGLFPIIETVE